MRLHKKILLGACVVWPVLAGCTIAIPAGNLMPAPALPAPPGALPPGQAPSLPRVIPGQMGSGLLGAVTPGPVSLRGAPLLPGPFDVPPPPVPTDIPLVDPPPIAIAPRPPPPVAPPVIASVPRVTTPPRPPTTDLGASLLGTDSCGPGG